MLRFLEDLTVALPGNLAANFLFVTALALLVLRD
jgi:hypothetical protein